MTKKKLPAIDELRKLLTYDPETGELFWNERPREMFPTDKHRRAFNAQYAG